VVGGVFELVLGDEFDDASLRLRHRLKNKRYSKFLIIILTTEQRRLVLKFLIVWVEGVYLYGVEVHFVEVGVAPHAGAGLMIYRNDHFYLWNLCE